MSTLSDGSILRALGITLQRDEHNVARPVADSQGPSGQGLVSVCAWCDWDKSQTRALHNLGKLVSHSICERHKQLMLDRIRAKRESGLLPRSMPEWLEHSTKVIS